MALPKVNNKKREVDLFQRYLEFRQTMKSEAFRVVGDTFESELPGSRSLFSAIGRSFGLVKSPQDQINKMRKMSAGGMIGQPRIIINMKPVLMHLKILTKNSNDMVFLTKSLIKHVDYARAELKVLNDLTLRNTNLSKQNLDMMRTYARLRTDRERDSEFEEQIAASKFVPQNQQPTQQPVHTQKKKEDSFFGKLKNLFAPVGFLANFKIISTLIKPVMFLLRSFLKIGAFVALVDIPMMIAGALSLKFLIDGIIYAAKKNKEGEKGFGKFLLNTLIGGGKSMDKMMKPLKDQLSDYMVKNKNFFKPLIVAFGNLFGVFIAEPMKLFFKMAFTRSIKTWGKSISEWFSNTVKHLSAFGDVLNETFYKPLGQALANNVFIPLKNKTISLFTTISDTVVNFVQQIKDTLVNMYNGVLDNIRSVIRKVVPEDNKVLGIKMVPNSVYEFAYPDRSATLFPVDKPKAEIQSHSKEMTRTAKIMTLQHNINNHNFATNIRNMTPIQQPNVVAPITNNNMNTNNYVATMPHTRNPNAQDIIKNNVAQ